MCRGAHRIRGGGMNTAAFNLKSARARKARFANLLDIGWLRGVLWAGSFTLSILGIVGVAYLRVTSGYLLVALAAWLLMCIAWYKGELKDLSIGEQPKDAAFDQFLERRLLGRLQEPLTPQSLAEAAMRLPGGTFFSARYAISFDFLKNLSSADAKDTAQILRYAQQLTQESGGNKEITSAAIVVALIFSIPDYNYYLAQLELDGDDLIAGLKWYNHIQQVVTGSTKNQKGGGLGRDLSFGWAPLLNRTGNNISLSISNSGMLRRELQGHEEALSQIMHLLSQPGRRNAALVGEVGVGKTTLVYALAQKLMLSPKEVNSELRYRQIIELDAAGLISKARGRGELEELLIHLFNEAIHAKNIIIFLDEAQLFLQEGTGSVDLSSILLPVLEGGALQIILAISDQEWLRLSQLNPGLAQLMNRVVVRPLDQVDTLRVLEDQILLLESRNPVVYMHQSLAQAYTLAERFIRDQAFPGKAIRLLEAAAGFPEQQHFITARSVQQAVEKSFDVKVQTASSTEERDMLLNLEGRIHERMINQTRAVQVVSDALRRARAGVRNQNKPIGTFLFLGPTGVGKTELSKALAALYFGVKIGWCELT